MSPLFGNREEKAAQKASSNAEIDRLVALPAPDLALEIVPAFGPDGPKGHGPNNGINFLQVIAFLTRSTSGADKAATRLQEPAREGVQVLENAGLVVRSGGREGSWYNATRLGQSASADGTVRQILRAT